MKIMKSEIGVFHITRLLIVFTMFSIGSVPIFKKKKKKRLFLLTDILRLVIIIIILKTVRFRKFKFRLCQ